MTPKKSSTKHSKLSNKKTGTRETTHGQIGGDMLSNKKTGRRDTNDGQPGGNKISNKKTETGITDGHTGSDKHSNIKTEIEETTDGQTGGDKQNSNKKTGTTGTTDGQTGGDKHSNKKTGTTGTTDGQTKDWAIRTPLKTGGWNSCAPDWWAVPAPLVPPNALKHESTSTLLLVKKEWFFPNGRQRIVYIILRYYNIYIIF